MIQSDPQGNLQAADNAAEQEVAFLFELLDEFFQHPNFCNVTKAMYQEVLAEIAESNLIDSILSDILGEPSHLEPINDRKQCAAIIRNGKYGIA